MESKPIKVLLIDDDEDDYILTRDHLSSIDKDKYDLEWNSEPEQMFSSIANDQHQLYLVDYRLGKITGLELIKQAIGMGCNKPIIILTGKGDEEIDREAMKLGAADYLTKDKLDGNILERSIRYSIERWLALRALVESEAKYRNLFEHSKDVIYVTDEDGNLITFNPSMNQLFGYAPNELANMRMTGLYVHSEDRDRLIGELKKTGQINDFEVQLKTKNGDVLTCLLSATLQSSVQEEKIIYQGIIHDITQRKQHEEDLLRTEKLELSSRIARMIAHEIRNPLTNIDLSLSQLKEDVLKKSDDDSAQIYTDIIQRNSKRINELVTDLLNSSKPKVLEKRLVDVADLVERTLQDAIDRIRLKNIELVKDFGCGDCQIPGDETYLKIALLNIVINAVEAVEENNGKLEVEIRKYGDNVVIRISDNGKGIPSDHLNKLFDPYFTSKQNGMGLGLTSTHNIITNHEGKIRVESTPGKGTTFIITLKSAQ